MLCRVAKINTPMPDHSDWDHAPWKNLSSERLCHYMGEKPEHFPDTRVKIAHNGKKIFLMFKVVDRYVRAVAQHHQSNVWEDSCVEFFFIPHDDLSEGYFNLEINCGGTLLFHFQTGPGEDQIVIPPHEYNRIKITHSLPCMVESEIEAPVTWMVACSIPIDILTAYCRVKMPAPGVQWRANFYKCADKTSHPHWLTWSPVIFSKPNFHLPQYFGILKFESADSL
jgi:hypothetical protein